MEKYSFTIKRKFYPGETTAMSPQLPLHYISDTNSAVPVGQNCNNCFFNSGGNCQYWKSNIRKNYWCDKWTNLNSTVFPTNPPCLTGFTVPIIITEDFNDIGVYTPFDGLVIQRNIINNFIYIANNLTVEVYNTSDLEFKRFLTFGDYTVYWGDGNSSTLTIGGPQLSTHTYGGAGSYTITLQQANPWGITKMQKIIKLPYTSQVNIPNPFGVLEIYPPNLGDPIACNSIYQSYLFSGDSNPDVYDFLSFNYVSVPYSVTGYTSNSRLSLFKQYGTNGIPLTGITIELVDKATGHIVDVTPTYTSYTVNNIIYTDFKNGKTYFNARSTGFDVNNLDWDCCTEEEDPTGCTCEEYADLGELIVGGNWSPGTAYMLNTIIEANGCCWVCTSRSLEGCREEPHFESREWSPCLPCVAPVAPVGCPCEDGTFSPECCDNIDPTIPEDCSLTLYMELRVNEGATSGWYGASVDIYFDNQFNQSYTVPIGSTDNTVTITIPAGQTMSVEYVGENQGQGNTPMAYKILDNGIEIFSDGYGGNQAQYGNCCSPAPGIVYCAECNNGSISEVVCLDD
jgi:hypothetical protein